MGLGVDDVFVMIRYFTDLGEEFLKQEEISVVMSEVFARGAPGVTLTSLCNIVAFGCGVMIEITVVQGLCLGGSIIAAFDLFMVLVVFPALLIKDAKRIKRGDLEPMPFTYPCQKAQMCSPSTAWDEKMVRALENSYVPLMMNG